MASCGLLFFAIQVVLLQTVYSQCLNRVVPSCGSNIVESFLPNSVLYREPTLPVIPTPACPGPVYPTPIYPSLATYPGTVIPETGYAPTIIQDSSVANSLANALQLLVVSNLLSTTLPGTCDLGPYPYEVVGMPPYNYIY